MAEGGGLLNRYTGNTVSRVRIPVSPFFYARETGSCLSNARLSRFRPSLGTREQLPRYCLRFDLREKHPDRGSFPLLRTQYDLSVKLT